jgi:hypothetical protein
MKYPKHIRTLDNSQPHEDYKGWENFLKYHTEIRDSYRGVTFFGVTNCNYILFKDGLLVCNCGYHGKSLMARLRKEGITNVKKDIKDSYKEIRKILDSWKHS